MGTFSDARVLIATVLDSVTGLTGHTFRPAIVKSGSAWPELVSVDRGPGDAFSGTWNVIVVLGGEEQAATNLADDVLPELVDELESTGIGYVPGAVPTRVDAGGSQMHALQVRVTSE